MLGYALPHMVHGILDCVDRRLKTESPTQRNLSSMCNDLVLASLEIGYYNHTYVPTNYGVKLVCMFIPITGLFVGIRHWHVSLGLSISMVCIGINTTALFMTYLGHAYEVPEKIQQLRLTILEKTGNLTKNQRNYLQPVVLRIPTCGIRAGRFYTSDRSTIPACPKEITKKYCKSVTIEFKKLKPGVNQATRSKKLDRDTCRRMGHNIPRLQISLSRNS
ncbi:unnamed protein product [Allacma fusca]|uniref:Uncharacterized protein n=1 Tax=Allacma fusca TaxID=39272 RepID=A0A8J2P3M5_9HEXA|nr:unnamed protein product [Allacma fusca]